MSQEHYEKLERMYLSAPTNEYYQPKIQVAHQQCQISINIEPKYFHSAGSLHGSVYFKLLDDSSFFAANSIISDVFVLTSSYNTYITKPVSGGILTGKGHVVSTSGKVILAESTVVDEEGKEVARGLGSFVPSRVQLSDKIGYR